MTRILVIDDEDGTRHTVRRILEAHGYEVAVAADGTAGLDQIDQFRPDLVVTDIIMPKTEGIETILALRRRAPGIRIIAMSGGARIGSADVLHAARLLGADATLAKPFDIEELLAAVNACLALPVQP